MPEGHFLTDAQIEALTQRAIEAAFRKHNRSLARTAAGNPRPPVPQQRARSDSRQVASGSSLREVDHEEEASGGEHLNQGVGDEYVANADEGSDVIERPLSTRTIENALREVTKRVDPRTAPTPFQIPARQTGNKGQSDQLQSGSWAMSIYDATMPGRGQGVGKGKGRENKRGRAHELGLPMKAAKLVRIGRSLSNQFYFIKSVAMLRDERTLASAKERQRFDLAHGWLQRHGYAAIISCTEAWGTEELQAKIRETFGPQGLPDRWCYAKLAKGSHTFTAARNQLLPQSGTPQELKRFFEESAVVYIIGGVQARIDPWRDPQYPILDAETALVQAQWQRRVLEAAAGQNGSVQVVLAGSVLTGSTIHIQSPSPPPTGPLEAEETARSARTARPPSDDEVQFVGQSMAAPPSRPNPADPSAGSRPRPRPRPRRRRQNDVLSGDETDARAAARCAISERETILQALIAGGRYDLLVAFHHAGRVSPSQRSQYHPIPPAYEEVAHRTEASIAMSRTPAGVGLAAEIEHPLTSRAVAMPVASASSPVSLPPIDADIAREQIVPATAPTSVVNDDLPPANASAGELSSPAEVAGLPESAAVSILNQGITVEVEDNAMVAGGEGLGAVEGTEEAKKGSNQAVSVQNVPIGVPSCPTVGQSVDMHIAEETFEHSNGPSLTMESAHKNLEGLRALEQLLVEHPELLQLPDHACDAGNHKRKASDGEHVPAGRTEGDDDQQQLTRGNDEEDISTPASVPPAKRRKVKAPIEPHTSTARDVKNQRPCLKVGKAARECHCGCAHPML